MVCKSCQSPVDAEGKFCAYCGEKLFPERLTVSFLIKTFLSVFLEYDNKLYRTFRHMFTQPESVIISYINGQRKKYVNVVTYFSISLTLIALQLFLLRKFYPESLVLPNDQFIEGFGLKDFNDSLLDYQGIITIIFTPFAAMMSRLAFIDSKKFNLAEHIIINIYPSAQIYIIWFFFTLPIVLFRLNFQMVSIYTVIVLTVYMIYIFKRVYDLSYLNAILRTVLYFILYGICFFILFFMIGLILITYFTMTGQMDPSTIINGN